MEGVAFETAGEAFSLGGDRAAASLPSFSSAARALMMVSLYTINRAGVFLT